MNMFFAYHIARLADWFAGKGCWRIAVRLVQVSMWLALRGER